MFQSTQLLNKSEALVQIPEDFFCPITHEVMENPFIAADGHTYEESAISKWLQEGRATSPLTGEKLAHTILIPNHKLKAIIKTFMEKIPEIQKQKSERTLLGNMLKLREEFIGDLISKYNAKKDNELIVETQDIKESLDLSYKADSKQIELDHLKKEKVLLKDLIDKLDFITYENDTLKQVLSKKELEIEKLKNQYVILTEKTGLLIRDSQSFFIQKFDELIAEESNKFGTFESNSFKPMLFSQISKQLINLSNYGHWTKNIESYGHWAIRMKRLPNAEVVCGFGDGTFKIYNMKDGSVVKSVKAHEGRLWDLDIFENKYLITCSQDKSIKFWDNFGHGNCIKTLEYESDVISVCGLSDNKFAIAGSNSKVSIWDFSTNQITKNLIGHQNVVQSLVHIPEKKILASSGGDSSIYIWSLETFEATKKLTGHKKLIFDLRKLANNFLISACDDNMTKIWDPSSGECVMTLVGHKHFVNGTSQLLDGNIVTSSEDKTIKVWNIKTGNCLKTISCHEHPVWGIETYNVSDKEINILSGDTQGTIFFSKLTISLDSEKILQNEESVTFNKFGKNKI